MAEKGQNMYMLVYHCT